MLAQDTDWGLKLTATLSKVDNWWEAPLLAAEVSVFMGDTHAVVTHGSVPGAASPDEEETAPV